MKYSNPGIKLTSIPLDLFLKYYQLTKGQNAERFTPYTLGGFPTAGISSDNSLIPFYCDSVTKRVYSGTELPDLNKNITTHMSTIRKLYSGELELFEPEDPGDLNRKIFLTNIGDGNNLDNYYFLLGVNVTTTETKTVNIKEGLPDTPDESDKVLINPVIGVDDVIIVKEEEDDSGKKEYVSLEGTYDNVNGYVTFDTGNNPLTSYLNRNPAIYTNTVQSNKFRYIELAAVKDLPVCQLIPNNGNFYLYKSNIPFVRPQLIRYKTGKIFISSNSGIGINFHEDITMKYLNGLDGLEFTISGLNITAHIDLTAKRVKMTVPSGVSGKSKEMDGVKQTITINAGDFSRPILKVVTGDNEKTVEIPGSAAAGSTAANPAYVFDIPYDAVSFEVDSGELLGVYTADNKITPFSGDVANIEKILFPNVGDSGVDFDTIYSSEKIKEILNIPQSYNRTWTLYGCFKQKDVDLYGSDDYYYDADGYMIANFGGDGYHQIKKEIDASGNVSYKDIQTDQSYDSLGDIQGLLKGTNAMNYDATKQAESSIETLTSLTPEIKEAIGLQEYNISADESGKITFAKNDNPEESYDVTKATLEEEIISGLKKEQVSVVKLGTLTKSINHDVAASEWNWYQPNNITITTNTIGDFKKIATLNLNGEIAYITNKVKKKKTDDLKNIMKSIISKGSEKAAINTIYQAESMEKIVVNEMGRQLNQINPDRPKVDKLEPIKIVLQEIENNTDTAFNVVDEDKFSIENIGFYDDRNLFERLLDADNFPLNEYYSKNKKKEIQLQKQITYGDIDPAYTKSMTNIDTSAGKIRNSYTTPIIYYKSAKDQFGQMTGNSLISTMRSYLMCDDESTELPNQAYFNYISPQITELAEKSDDDKVGFKNVLNGDEVIYKKFLIDPFLSNNELFSYMRDRLTDRTWREVKVNNV